MACSMPPMYWSTGIQYASAAGSQAASSLVGVAVAQEVPGRVDERVHRVGLALGRPAARRAGDVGPSPRRRRAASARVGW